MLRKAGSPAIQEQPLQKAIADVREWNAQLRESARARVAEEHARKLASLTAKQKIEEEEKFEAFVAKLREHSDVIRAVVNKDTTSTPGVHKGMVTT